MKRAQLLLAISVLGLSGCGPLNIQLTSAGYEVVLVDSKADLPASCRYLGFVVADIGANFQTFSHNVELAQTKVRNDAANKNGTHVLVGAPEESKTNSWAGAGGNCRNCVKITGKVFRCK